MIPESNAGLVECRYPSLFPQGAGARAGSFAHTPHTDTAHMGYAKDLLFKSTTPYPLKYILLYGFLYRYVLLFVLLFVLLSRRHWRQDTRPRLRERAHPHEACKDVARPLDHGLAGVAQPPKVREHLSAHGAHRLAWEAHRASVTVLGQGTQHSGMV